MNRVVKAAAFAALALSGSAAAVVPESGLWYNPDEGGRGYGIEVQDDRVFVTYYGFQPDGQKSAFYTTFGTLNPNTGVVTGYFAAAENGQCFGCAYRNPQLTDLGEARLQFTSPTTGRITLPGNIQIPIQRQLMYGAHLQDRSVIKGVWAFTSGTRGIYDGELLWMKADLASQPNGVSGHRIDAPTRILVGGSTTGSNVPAYLILLDSSASYYKAIAFDNSVGHLTGRTWLYPKTGSLSGAGNVTFGYKVMGAKLTAGAASSSPELSADEKAAAIDRQAIADEQAYLSGLAGEFDGAAPGTVMIGEKAYAVDAIRQAVQAMEHELR